QAEGPNTWKAVISYHNAGPKGDAPISETTREHELPLFITAGLVPVLSIRPAHLVLQTESSITAEFQLIERRPQALAVREIGTTSPHVFVSPEAVPHQVDGKWVRTFTIRVPLSCPEGRHDDVVAIHTTDPLFPDLRIPVTVVKKVSQKVKSFPTSL